MEMKMSILTDLNESRSGRVGSLRDAGDQERQRQSRGTRQSPHLKNQMDGCLHHDNGMVILMVYTHTMIMQ